MRPNSQALAQLRSVRALLCVQPPPFSKLCRSHARGLPLVPRTARISTAYGLDAATFAAFAREAGGAASGGAASGGADLGGVAVVVYMSRGNFATHRGERCAVDAALASLRYTEGMWERAAALVRLMLGGRAARPAPLGTSGPLGKSLGMSEPRHASDSAPDDAAVAAWLNATWPMFTAVQWRHEGAGASAEWCARTMLKLAPGWGCTPVQPCVLISDIAGFDGAPQHDSHQGGFGLGTRRRAERAALAALLGSKAFVKADTAMEAAADWRPVAAAGARAGGRLSGANESSNALLTVADKLLAAGAALLVTCDEGCGGGAACAPCCRGPWRPAHESGRPEQWGAVGAPSLIVREIVALRRRLGRPTQRCW